MIEAIHYRTAPSPVPMRHSGEHATHHWMEQILSDLEATDSEQDAYDKIVAAVRELGFEYCAYCLHAPWPLSRPKTYMLTNFPDAWLRRYREARYVEVDPIIRHARQSHAPIIWSDAAFEDTPQLWAEAQAHGLRHGYSLAAVSNSGIAGMMSMVRSHGPLTRTELERGELKMRWLVNAAHLTLARALQPKLLPDTAGLTEREVEVLKWVADGKTSTEIAMILLISVYTVNFHVKNAVAKLKTTNKTAAVARAAMLGLLV